MKVDLYALAVQLLEGWVVTATADSRTQLAHLAKTHHRGANCEVFPIPEFIDGSDRLAVLDWFLSDNKLNERVLTVQYTDEQKDIMKAAIAGHPIQFSKLCDRQSLLGVYLGGAPVWSEWETHGAEGFTFTGEYRYRTRPADKLALRAVYKIVSEEFVVSPQLREAAESSDLITDLLNCDLLPVTAIYGDIGSATFTDNGREFYTVFKGDLNNHWARRANAEEMKEYDAIIKAHTKPVRCLSELPVDTLVRVLGAGDGETVDGDLCYTNGVANEVFMNGDSKTNHGWQRVDSWELVEGDWVYWDGEADSPLADWVNFEVMVISDGELETQPRVIVKNWAYPEKNWTHAAGFVKVIAYRILGAKPE